VILLHEIDGMKPEFCRTAARIAENGFTVYAPLIFGRPNEKMSVLRGGLTVMCVRREFDLLHGQGSSRITPWLRALSRHVHELTGRRGVGVIGMCLTGNVVISMMLEDCVKVPVACEPALPFAHRHALGVPEPDLKDAARISCTKPLYAYRFTEDWICPRERFVALRKAFPAEGLHTCEIPSGTSEPFVIPRAAHSVLTGNYLGQEDPNHPVQHVLDEILMQLRTRLI
jgi:dienelactone hydrolase